MKIIKYIAIVLFSVFISNISFATKPSELINMKKLIFPGVGAFDAIYENVKKKNLLELFNKIVVLNKPLLGICVGFQLLAESSIENKVTPGLKIIKGNIRPIKEFCGNLSVPHVGWNSCNIINKNNLFDGIENNSDFYFTHSYYLASKENKCISTLTNYGDDFISSVKINNSGFKRIKYIDLTFGVSTIFLGHKNE